MNKEFTNEEKKAVFISLENPKYKWRTIDGISKETGIEEEKVVSVIKANNNEIVESARKSKTGKNLYTTRANFRKKSSFIDKFVGSIKNRSE